MKTTTRGLPYKLAAACGLVPGIPVSKWKARWNRLCLRIHRRSWVAQVELPDRPEPCGLPDSDAFNQNYCPGKATGAAAAMAEINRVLNQSVKDSQAYWAAHKDAEPPVQTLPGAAKTLNPPEEPIREKDMSQIYKDGIMDLKVQLARAEAKVLSLKADLLGFEAADARLDRERVERRLAEINAGKIVMETMDEEPAPRPNTPGEQVILDVLSEEYKKLTPDQLQQIFASSTTGTNATPSPVDPPPVQGG